MTQIDFYILPGATPDGRQVLACKLAEKALKHGRRVFIHTESPAETGHLDHLLWTFRAGSFLPHSTQHNQPPNETPIVIGDSDPHGEHCDVLINLDRKVPVFFSRFDRVTELVDQNTEQLSSGRKRFQFYRERGYPLESHNLKNG